MLNRVDIAYVRIWGMLVGAVSWDPDKEFAAFEFDRKFLEKGLDLSPLKMPITGSRKSTARFEFRTLPRRTFKGLPGLLADALPDNFGNSIIDSWLARSGRTPDSFSPVERLCYTGKRAMGALEFSPIINEALETSVPVEISELINLAQMVTDERSKLKTHFEDNTSSEALLDIIRVGTSAGGNRPKAVIALNDQTKEVRSGQVEAPEGFDYWILKFDGVKDQSLGDPAGYGRIEYAYSKMAVSSGINMTECRLLQENGRAHFMTRRFDRVGRKRCQAKMFKYIASMLLLKDDRYLDLKIYSDNKNNFLVVLCPVLEEWILKTAALEKIKMAYYNLPGYASRFHKTINLNLLKFEILLESMLTSKRITALKSVLLKDWSVSKI